MWVRGLKHHSHKCHFCALVAPYVGAWIETSSFEDDVKKFKSHPMWVRGLKLLVKLLKSVIWTVAPYVGAWIETV